MTGHQGVRIGDSPSAFEAAEVAYDRALEHPDVTGAKKLEEILGGDGTYTADVAYRRWLTEMTTLGFPEYEAEQKEEDNTE